MLKYSVACLATLYCILILFGDESRKPAVTRQAQDDVTGFTLTSFALPEADVTTKTLASGISDAEAVRIALEAGKAYRTDRKLAPLRGGRVAAIATETKTGAPVASADVDGPLRYVTGSRVNLRAGPGTGNAVVGQVVLGDAAEVLDDRDGWYQIRTTDGATSGWIFGRFLGDRRPG